MKKDAGLTRLFQSLTMGFMVFALALLSAGCGSLLTYSGPDFDKSKVRVVETNEGFVFSTYPKTSALKPISLRLGVSRTYLPEVFVAYLELTNTSSENQTFITRDLKITAQGAPLEIVSAADYISAYQGDNTNMITSMQAIAPTLRNMVSVSNEYRHDNISAMEDYAVLHTSSREIKNIIDGIARHSVSSAVILRPNSTQYRYVFFRDREVFPIEIEYRDLKYSFSTSSSRSK
jgi:hypothetical protein